MNDKQALKNVVQFLEQKCETISIVKVAICLIKLREIVKMVQICCKKFLISEDIVKVKPSKFNLDELEQECFFPIVKIIEEIMYA